uniref:Uncharacterized protein n=1 Tax=viral metagenome TaxID=1070528 RepID=A0A6M3L6S4_9ZZZZ
MEGINMPIIDSAVVPESVQEGAHKVRGLFRDVLGLQSNAMTEVVSVVARHGRAAIAAALNANNAGDAAEMLALFNRWRADVASVYGEGLSHANPSKLIPELPA